MANTIKTLGNGDITRKALSILHNRLVFCKTINRQYDDRFTKTGALNGGSLLIREPNQFAIRTGATLDTQDVTETTQTLTVATQRGVDVNFSSVELTLSMDDFSERILEPAMARLASELDKVVMTSCYQETYNLVPGTLANPTVIADVQSARSLITKGLAPDENRSLIMESLSMNSVVTEAKALFHPASEVEMAWNKGYLGRTYGFKLYETETILTHTHGTRTDTTPVSATSAWANGDTTIAITSAASASTLTRGDVFTVANVYAVNAETKVQQPHLQQFTVLTAITATSTSVTPTVGPTIYVSGPKQNVSVTSAGSSAVENLDFGAASTAYLQNLAYHKDAYTLVTADLQMPNGTDLGARDVYDGISLRIIRDYDIINDKFPCRMDVLFGQKAIRPEWACRLSAD